MSKQNRRNIPSFDNATLPILNSPDYISSKPQLNHLFIDNEYFSEAWHGDHYMNVPDDQEFRENWRVKDKMKTSGAILLVCLNIGVDPPDIIKPPNCARKECWFDPSSTSKQKALENIGTLLQQQYEKLQSKAKFKQCLDPTAHELERVCVNLRRQIRSDRLLLHYNGHGVPRPTKNGELWVFGKHYTHYMPVSMHDLRGWIGEPSIYVLDCSGAGALLPHCIVTPPGSPGIYPDYINEPHNGTESDGVNIRGYSTSRNNQPRDDLSSGFSDSTSYVLAACKSEESLPLNPLYPADLFSACLTTPIPIALKWFIYQNPHLSHDISPDIIDNLPGKDGDRKTPKGLLNWIFTAIADTIAWSTIPAVLFQKLFRQDLLVASLFRNFLLAKRIMRSFNCTPLSHPPLPDCSTHPLWQAWDAAVEHCLLFVNKMNNSLAMDTTFSHGNVGSVRTGFQSQNNNSTTNSIIHSPFFNDHLTAFEIWLDFGGPGGSYRHNKEPPIYLPILLQALLSHAHRLKALHLLRRYVALGFESVHSALAVGVFPYILKLLHNPVVEIRNALMSIWTYVIGFDISCREELVKDIREKGESKFLLCLKNPESPYHQRTMAAFIHAEICNKYRTGQELFLEFGYHRIYASLLTDPTVVGHTHLKKWIILALAKLCEDFIEAKNQCIRSEIHLSLYPLLQDTSPAVRIATIYALGNLLGASIISHPSGVSYTKSLNYSQSIMRGKEIEIALQILESYTDGCAVVRREAMIAVSKIFTLSSHSETILFLSNAVNLFSIEFDNIQDESIPIVHGSPSRPSSMKGTKRGTNSTPRKPRPTTTTTTTTQSDINLNNWTLSQTQLSDLASNLQKFLESRQFESSPHELQGSSILFQDDHTTDNLLPPSLHSNNLNSSLQGVQYSSSHVLASSYIQLWFCLLEVQGTDPHPLVVKVAKQIFAYVKLELMRGNFYDLPEGTFDNVGNVNKKLDSSLDQYDNKDFTSKNQIHEYNSSTMNNNNNINNNNNNNSVNSFDHDGNIHMSPFNSNNNFHNNNINNNNNNNNNINNSQTINDNNNRDQLKVLNDIGLQSSTYEWNRKYFLQPDLGYEPLDDLLSLEGRERSTRILMREEIKDLAHRIDESFRPIQDSGLTTLLDKDTTSPVSLDGSSYSLSSQSGNQDFQRQGMSASLLPSSLTKFESKGILRVEGANLTSNTMFHAFHDILAVTDDKGVGIWSLENGTQIMHIRSSPSSSSSTGLNNNSNNNNNNISSNNNNNNSNNSNNSSNNNNINKNSLITSMTWVNESLNSLLMVGSDDGAVRIWKDVGDSIEESGKILNEGDSTFQMTSGVTLTSAFKALPDVTGGSVGSGMIMSWQQSSGMLSVGGNSNTIRLWDVSQEKCVTIFQTGIETCLTTLVSQTASLRTNFSDSSWGAGIVNGSNNSNSFSSSSSALFAWSFAGFADGSIGIYDQRVDTRGGRVHMAKEHNSWIVSAHLRADIPEVVTGAVSGGVNFWDIRTMRSYKTIEVHKSPLTALTVHNCAPIMATGSQAQFIKILTLAGDQLGMIRYHDGFMGNRIGPVSCLAFHPVRMLMAAGSTDNLVSIYSIPNG